MPVQLAVVLTVVAAVVFQPLRRRLEPVADRWVFGERANRYQLVTSFGASLEQAVDLDELLPRLASTVRRGLGARGCGLPCAATTPGPGCRRPQGCPGRRRETPLSRGATPPGRGRRTDRVRARDDGYDETDRELLVTLAGQAATAIANVRLTARLSEQVAELARSRARIVAAQDGERRRIERDIHDGVQQASWPCSPNSGWPATSSPRGESPEELLVELQAEARELLTDLRELAHGIHPPVLTDGGLVAAVEARAGRLPLGVTVRADDSMRGTTVRPRGRGGGVLRRLRGAHQRREARARQPVPGRRRHGGRAAAIEVATTAVGFKARH